MSPNFRAEKRLARQSPFLNLISHFIFVRFEGDELFRFFESTDEKLKSTICCDTDTNVESSENVPHESLDNLVQWLEELLGLIKKKSKR